MTKYHQAFCWAAVTLLSGITCGVLGHFLAAPSATFTVMSVSALIAGIGWAVAAGGME